jgi:hypothetical protein
MAALEGVSHIGFVDLPYLVDDPSSASRNLGSADPHAVRQMTNAISLAFL